MSEVTVTPYDGVDAADWDALVESSCNGTLLHTRRFLSYHGDRFKDRSLVVRDKRGRLIGVLAAAEDLEDPTSVVSHPGITYGGLVHNGALRGERLIGAISAAAKIFAELGYSRFLYKSVPWIYHRRPAADDLYALFRLGALRSACYLSAAIDLSREHREEHGRRSGRKLAERAGIRIERGWSNIRGFWDVLQATLADRYGALPIHSLDEIQEIHDLFPHSTELLVAFLGDQLVAGAVFFLAGPVLHSQYIASNEDARRTSALDLVFAEAIGLAGRRECRFFDFGTSNEDAGRYLNDPLYQFKTSFGAGGVALEHYELGLPLADHGPVTVGDP